MEYMHTCEQKQARNGRLRILIAEDMASNYRLLEVILRKEYDLEWAHDGKEAVEMALQNAYDLILMDIKMPYMDGLEATRVIRSHNPDIPIIAQTAYAYEHDLRKTLEAGCNTCITKPIRVPELLRAIKGLVGVPCL